jgi:hypothetical protein
MIAFDVVENLNIQKNIKFKLRILAEKKLRLLTF